MITTLHTPRLNDYLKLLLLATLWSTAFIAIKASLDTLSPLWIAALRTLGGALILGSIMLIKREPLPLSRHSIVLNTAIGALSTGIPFFLINYGQQSIPSSLTAMLIATGPIFALVMTHFAVNDDRITLGKALRVICGLTGVVLILGGGELESDAQLAGAGFILMASFCYASASLLTRYSRDISPLGGATLALILTSLWLIPITLMIEPVSMLAVHPWEAYLPIIYLAIGPTALAHLLRYNIVQGVGTNFTSQVSFFIPPLALLWGWLFFAEQLHTTALFGLGFILIGMILQQRMK